MRYLRLSLIALLVWSCGCSHGSPASEHQAVGRTVVVWLSLDGFGPDYFDRAPTPALHRLLAQGAWSRHMTTITPSLTFPSHVSEATGVTADLHGIPANDFYDAATGKQYNFPSDPSMLESEPIWTTAKRQNVRTLVYEWPFAQGQSGPLATDYFLPAFENKPTVEERVDRLLATWRDDHHAEPLRLLMGYIKATDVLGHSHGPASPEVTEKIGQIDALIAHLVDQSAEIFRQKMSPNDRRYIVLTTDHGMAPVHTLVNLEKLFANPLPHAVKHVTSGPLGMIYFDQLPATQAAEMKTSMLGELGHDDFLDVYPRDSLPAQWHFAHPTRVGDILVMLHPGFTFSTRLPLATFAVEKVGTPKGMHGYPQAICPQMAAFCIFWRYPKPLGGRDLGDTNELQIHPSVAALLHIKPATRATAAPLLRDQ
jgi:hypothetical protein